MSGKRSRSSAGNRARKDDLKHINGISTAIESRLHDEGIFTFARLAAMSPDDLINRLGESDELTLGRILHEDWTGQARVLAAQSKPPAPSVEASAETARNHPYANFAVELKLNDDRTVARTRVMHTESGNEDSWAGWDDKRLIGFLTQRADLARQTAVLAAAPAMQLAREIETSAHH